MVTALELFIVPRSMWPVGLVYAADLRDQLDGIADRIICHVKAGFKEPPGKFDFSSKTEIVPGVKQYYICKPVEASGLEAPCQDRCHCKPTLLSQRYSIYSHRRCAVPAPIQERLIARASACFLKLKFNPIDEQPKHILGLSK